MQPHARLADSKRKHTNQTLLGLRLRSLAHVKKQIKNQLYTWTWPQLHEAVARKEIDHEEQLSIARC